MIIYSSSLASSTTLSKVLMASSSSILSLDEPLHFVLYELLPLVLSSEVPLSLLFSLYEPLHLEIYYFLDFVENVFPWVILFTKCFIMLGQQLSKRLKSLILQFINNLKCFYKIFVIGWKSIHQDGGHKIFFHILKPHFRDPCQIFFKWEIYSKTSPHFNHILVKKFSVKLNHCFFGLSIKHIFKSCPCSPSSRYIFNMHIQLISDWRYLISKCLFISNLEFCKLSNINEINWGFVSITYIFPHIIKDKRTLHMSAPSLVVLGSFQFSLSTKILLVLTSWIIYRMPIIKNLKKNAQETLHTLQMSVIGDFP